jgi:hypothetical protein
VLRYARGGPAPGINTLSIDEAAFNCCGINDFTDGTVTFTITPFG